jgi:hypothetical protein
MVGALSCVWDARDRLRAMRTKTKSTVMVAMVGAALAVALAACGGTSSAPAIGNTATGTTEGAGELRTAAGPGFRDGALWSCQISDYDPQPCKLQRVDDHWELRKLMGSQRFAGELREQGPSLRFAGRFFCPWGACDATMDVAFERADGGYLGTFDGDQIRLRYDEALEAEYGGVGYGGLTGEEQ